MRQRAFHAQHVVGKGVWDEYPACMQSKTRASAVARPIERVAEQGMLYCGQMDTDLMSAPGVQPTANPCEIRKITDYKHIGSGSLSLL